MSVGQVVFAFISPEPRGTGPSGGADEGADGFASLLASQNSGDDLSLASGGKTLPDTLELWMDDALAGLEEAGVVTASGEEAEAADLTEGAQRWLQWLDSARASLDRSALGEPVAEGSLAPNEAEQPDAPEVLATGGVMPAAVTPEALKPAGLDPRDALVSALDDAKGKAGRKELPVEANARDASARAQATEQQAQTAPLQRTASVALAAEAQAFGAQRMPDPEALLPRRKATESEALEGLGRPGAAQAAPGQAALIARPVNAVPQALGVPFGQPGWGEAMVEKVMWMSSQNLRSVEIRLDPAELGPLEIHIQSRGQDNQVQFLSQNPSVREALESQMFRLREMFAQQGMERVEVTVADHPQRDAQRGQEQGGLGDQRGQQSRGSQPAASDAGESILTTQAAARVSSDRLVDYYA